MPEPTVSGHVAQRASVAWFGKLPSQGDFVGRRMPHATVNAWDDWMRSGLDMLRNESPANWEQRFVHSPLWFFLSPAAVLGVPTVGVLAPSVDRIGRCYPIWIMAAADTVGAEFASDSVVIRFLTEVRDAVINARRLPLSADQLDAQLANLCTPFASADATVSNGLIDAILENLSSSELQATGSTAELPNVDWRALRQQAAQTTVWWISPTPQFPRDEVIHHGPLSRPLFTRLFKGQTR